MPTETRFLITSPGRHRPSLQRVPSASCRHLPLIVLIALQLNLEGPSNRIDGQACRFQLLNPRCRCRLGRVDAVHLDAVRRGRHMEIPVPVSCQRPPTELGSPSKLTMRSEHRSAGCSSHCPRSARTTPATPRRQPGGRLPKVSRRSSTLSTCSRTAPRTKSTHHPR